MIMIINVRIKRFFFILVILQQKKTVKEIKGTYVLILRLYEFVFYKWHLCYNVDLFSMQTTLMKHSTDYFF